MKQYVTTADGEMYTAANALEFVKALKDSSRTALDLTLNQFMRDVARRVQQDTGFKVRAHGAEAFLADLLHAGVVKEVVAAQ